MLRIGEEAAGRTPAEAAAARLHEARRLDHDIVEVDAALQQAEDSLRLNPRVREGLLHRVVLRTGLDTLEICTVVLRVLARTLTDLAKEREPEPLFAAADGGGRWSGCSPRSATRWSASRCWSPPTSAVSAESAEARLAAELSAATATRDKLAQLLLEEVQRDAEPVAAARCRADRGQPHPRRAGHRAPLPAAPGGAGPLHPRAARALPPAHPPARPRARPAPPATEPVRPRRTY